MNYGMKNIAEALVWRFGASVFISRSSAVQYFVFNAAHIRQLPVDW